MKSQSRLMFVLSVIFGLALWLMLRPSERVHQVFRAAEGSGEVAATKQVKGRPHAATGSIQAEPPPAPFANNSNDITKGDDAVDLALDRPSGGFRSLKDEYIAQLRRETLLGQRQYWNKEVRAHVTEFLYRRSEGKAGAMILQELRHAPQESPFEHYVVEAEDFILTAARDLSTAESRALLMRYGLKSMQSLGGQGVYRVAFETSDLEQRLQLRRRLQNDPLMKSVEDNSLFFVSKVPKDTYFDRQWGLDNSGAIGGNPELTNMIRPKKGNDIAASAAWDEATDCTATPVAVLDTGIDATHPDLSSNVVTNLGRNFTTNNPNDTMDRQGHGTNVAGIIASVGDNNVGLAGVCWKARLIAVKVLNDAGSGTAAQIISGLNYAAQSEAKIINMSLGGGASSQAQASATTAAGKAGKLLVIAAGNNGTNNDVTPMYPASYPDEEIVSVAAVGANGDITGFSNFGSTSVDIAAPGDFIAGPTPVAMAPGGQNPAQAAYSFISGTSQATPHVAGALALIWSTAPKMTNLQVKSMLMKVSPKGSFTNKAVGSGQQLSLPVVLDALKTRGKLRDLNVGDQVVARNSNKIKLPIEIIPGYAQADKVEILAGDKVLASGTGPISELDIAFNPLYKQLDLIVRVTDTEGRVTSSTPLKVNIGAEKFLDFSELNTVAGNQACSLLKVAPDGSIAPLLEKNLDSAESCRRLCSFVGPLSYSSFNEIRCGTPEQSFYRKAVEN